MTDDRSKPSSSGIAGATPNRDRPREASTIDARPEDIKEIKPEGSRSGTSAGSTGASPAMDQKKTGGEPAGAAATHTPPAGQKAGAEKASSTGSGASAASVGTTRTASETKSGGEKRSGTTAAGPSATGPTGAGTAPASGSGARDGASGPTGAGNRPAPPPSGGGGFGAMAGAGIVGAAIALLGGWGYQNFAGSGAAVGGLADRLKAAETAIGQNKASLAALQKSAAVAGELEKRLTALEAALKQQAATTNTLRTDVGKLAGAKPAELPDIKPLETRLAALEKLFESAKSSIRAEPGDPQVKPADDGKKPPAAGQPSATGETPAQVAASGANKAASGAGTSDRPGETAPPAAVPAAVRSLGNDIARLATRLAALEQIGARISDLEKKIQPPADLTPLNAKIAELSGKLAPLEKQIAASIEPVARAVAETKTSIADNAKAIAATGEKVSSSIVRSNAAASAVVARSLVERIQSGKPFVEALDAAEKAGANKDAVAALKSLADKGAPTRDALLTGFMALESRILEPAKPKPNAPLGERLKQAAFSLVKVRPVGETEGDSAGALFARIAGALRGGDLAEAGAVFAKLPESARAVGADWAKMLQQRIAADKAVETIVDDALALLQKTKS